ncbi:hypothetical protein CspHIS471_0700070 [Cutaneotrichosporon sp. HIS471]|nr:hypothetical protein CspHIS471_0700070 [Cutaneotrichosporon sp. HIS471]
MCKLCKEMKAPREQRTRELDDQMKTACEQHLAAFKVEAENAVKAQVTDAMKRYATVKEDYDEILATFISRKTADMWCHSQPLWAAREAAAEHPVQEAVNNRLTAEGLGRFDMEERQVVQYLAAMGFQLLYHKNGVRQESVFKTPHILRCSLPAAAQTLYA